MKITKAKLSALSRKYRGYLKGAKVDAFLNDFGIKFAAGHWCAGPFVDRFASDGYTAPEDNLEPGLVGQLKRVAKAGIKGVEVHGALFFNDKLEVDDAKVREAKAALKEYKLTATNMNTDTWSHPRWKLGGITNPNPRLRRLALDVALKGIDIAKEIGCSSVALWPGSDGWDYNFQANYGKLLDHFISGCITINKKAKKAGLGFGVEAKLHEPREGNMILATTHKSMAVCMVVNRECKGRNMGVAIDYGHEQMYGNEPADNLYTAKVLGVPVVNFHLNTAKLHSNDEDRVAGTGDNWRFADFCYAAIDTGYDGWFGEDQFTYRMEPIKAMSLSREIFANIMKKALMIYAKKDELTKAQATGRAERTIDAVKEILI